MFLNPSRDAAQLRFDDSVVSIPRDRRLRKVYLELSSRCNLDCPICFLRNSPEARGDMDPGLLEDLMAQLAGFPDLEWVHFEGNRGAVHPNAFEPWHCSFKGWRVRLTTNGPW